jgi:hypothetical protein
MANTSPSVNVRDIPKCVREWEVFEKKSSDSFKAYRASNLKDQTAIDNAHQSAERGFEAYYRCFRREAKNQPFYRQLKRQAQSLVNRLANK